MLLVVTRHYKTLQGVTGFNRELQRVNEGYKGLRGLQGVTRCCRGCKGLQGLTRRYIGLQGVTGVTRSTGG